MANWTDKIFTSAKEKRTTILLTCGFLLGGMVLFLVFFVMGFYCLGERFEEYTIT